MEQHQVEIRVVKRILIVFQEGSILLQISSLKVSLTADASTQLFY